MINLKNASLMGGLILFLFLTHSFADYTPITVADPNWEPWQVNYYSSLKWYDDDKSGYLIDDNEVEFGMQAHQKWDLEGFFLDGNELAMVGGFNFADGYGGMEGGDLFIDVDGDADGEDGWDYAIVMDFDNETYTVFKLDENSVLSRVHDYNSPGSDPFQYVSGGEVVAGQENVAFNYSKVEGENQFGVKGDRYNDTHYVVSGIDLGFLGTTDFTAHYTMECGNDNLMGKGSISVPEPATLSLFSMGSICMLGFWFFQNRKRKK